MVGPPHLTQVLAVHDGGDAVGDLGGSSCWWRWGSSIAVACGGVEWRERVGSSDFRMTNATFRFETQATMGYFQLGDGPTNVIGLPDLLVPLREMDLWLLFRLSTNPKECEGLNSDLRL